ncbi:MAG: methyltransferase domain-containing protein [Pseudomonadota bacterium]
MALPDTLAARLIETTFEHKLSGRLLMLGRQRWIGSRKGKAATFFAETIERYLPGITEADLCNTENHFSETFFRTLGYDHVDSMDFSEFEGASIIQDLSQPLDPSLEGQFDVIYDGGTCEHIFELPTAYRNIDRMLKTGGVLIGHSPCNNWINHSFYQINPEMVYGFWEKAMGYEVLELFLQPLLPNFSDRIVTTTNPNETGVRPRLQGELPKNSRIIMCYAVRKPAEATGTGRAYQTDYVEKWNDENQSGV